MTKFRSPEALIRQIMGGQAAPMPLDESVAAATLHNSSPYDVGAALKVLADNGVDCAKKVDDTTISIGACHSLAAANILNNAIMHDLIKAVPKLVSAEVVPTPAPAAPVKEDVNSVSALNTGHVDLKTGKVELEPRSLHNRMENQTKKIDEEQIDELSKKTLSNYIPKAAVAHGEHRASQDRHNGEAARADNAGDDEKSEYHDDMAGKHADKAINRMAGIRKAVKKLQEGEQLAELSKPTLNAYVGKVKSTEKHMRATRDPKLTKRISGVNKAVDKILEAVQTISEAGFDAKADAAAGYTHHIVDTHTKGVVGRAKSLNSALRSSDKRNLDYGAHRYTHRRISENVEPIEELSNGTLRSYIEKGGDQKRNAFEKGDRKTYWKRHTGINKAANKVDEEVVNEVSNKTLVNYVDKAKKSSHQAVKDYSHHTDMKAIGHGGESRDKNIATAKKTFEKRAKGMATASRKSDDAAYKVRNEEVEQVDELSKPTLNRYVGKAFADKRATVGTGQEMLRKTGAMGQNDETDVHQQAVKKRGTGIVRALNKLKEEAEQVDELSTETLKSYTDHAHRSWEKASMARDHKKANNRWKGMTKALDKTYARESVEITEGKKEDAEKAGKKFAAHPRAEAMHADMIHASKHYNYVQDATDHVYTNNMKHVKYADWHEMKPHIENHFREHGLED